MVLTPQPKTCPIQGACPETKNWFKFKFPDKKYKSCDALLLQQKASNSWWKKGWGWGCFPKYMVTFGVSKNVEALLA